MKEVEPIRSKVILQEFIKHLKKNSHPRDYAMFMTGLNTALRIGEILSLNYNTIFTQEGKFRRYAEVKVKSTNKKRPNKIRKVMVNSDLQPILKKYADTFGLTGDDPLFFSLRKPYGRLDRINAWITLKKHAEFVGIANFGTHTMRKTWGYWAYKETKNLGLVMKTLNHNRPDVTLRYIGITQDMVDESLNKSYWK